MVQRCAFLITAAIVGACASTQYGATEANLARARSASATGATLFQQQCAGCHGDRGESRTGAPRILGEDALPEYPRPRDVNTDPASGDPEALRLEAQSRPQGAPWRDPFRTAKDLYDFVSNKMPPSEKKRASLSAEDYWAIVNFMLLAHGVPVPPEGVTETNAGSVKL
jgi:cytochrome c5